MVFQGNFEAEKLMLGCILLDNSLVKQVVVQPEQMSIMHQGLLRAMLEIGSRGEVINRATLHEKLGSSHMAQLDLSEMMEGVPSVKGYKLYEKLVMNAWKRGEIRRLAEEMLMAPDEVDIRTGEDRVDVFLREAQQFGGLEAAAEEFDLRGTLDAMYEQAVKGERPSGLLTGYRDYDRLTNGHGKGQFIIVAARPSVGKTAFALNVAAGHLRMGAGADGSGLVEEGSSGMGGSKGVYGHLYSLEMSSEQFLQRMISARGRINSQKLRDPVKRFDKGDWERYTAAVEAIGKERLYICDRSSVKVSEIYGNTKRLIDRYPSLDHFVVIDYLQLLRPITKRSNRQEEVAEISRALKVMARDLNVPVIALSQLSRGVESRLDKRPGLSDLRESGSLEQDADIVAFLYREDYYDRAGAGVSGSGGVGRGDVIEVIVAKQREGPVGTVELEYEKEFNLFV